MPLVYLIPGALFFMTTALKMELPRLLRTSRQAHDARRFSIPGLQVAGLHDADLVAELSVLEVS